MNDGGSAFPFYKGDAISGYTTEHGLTSYNIENPGMSLRDYFAAQCLMGMCCTMEMVAKMDAPERARYAYLNADAMLAERAK